MSRERTEKSKRLKALKGLYNIHYQRVSLCEISLGSASTRGGHGLLAPSISPSSQPSSSALHRTAIFLSSIRALALPQHPASLVSGGAEQSRDRPCHRPARAGKGRRGNGKRRRKEKRGGSASLMKMSHTPGTPARLLGLESADPGQGTC